MFWDDTFQTFEKEEWNQILEAYTFEGVCDRAVWASFGNRVSKSSTLTYNWAHLWRKWLILQPKANLHLDRSAERNVPQPFAGKRHRVINPQVLFTAHNTYEC